MIIAIYARVSTTDQSCEMELHELRQYVAKQGWQVFAEYVDTGFSGQPPVGRSWTSYSGTPGSRTSKGSWLEAGPLGP